jgi:hypothetical protein
MKFIKLISCIWLTSALTIGFYSCTDSTAKTTIDDTDSVVSKDHNISISNEVEQKPETVAIEFLKWYRDHQELARIHMVNNMYQDDPTFKPGNDYSINFDSTEYYLDKFRQSGYVSDAYINYWRNYFKKVGDDLKAHLQKDGIVEALDSDLVTKSQDDVLRDLDKVKVVLHTVGSSESLIQLQLYQGPALSFKMTKNGGEWLIDRID